MKRVITVLAAALAVLTIASCGSTDLDYPASRENFNSSPYSAPASSSPAEQAELQQPENAGTIDRKIIKKGDIRFETADVNQTKSLIVQAVRELNGYLSKDNVEDYANRLEHKLIIRVPADKFDLLLQNISENVDKFDSQNIDALDVTEEYIDIQSRVKTKKELQTRYTELLKSATSIDEMLNIEREIGKLQTEIESAEGRMRYLHDRIAFSTLAVTYYQKMTSETAPFSFSSELTDGIKTGWKLFLWFIIGLSYLWVFITFIIVIVAATYLLVRRKGKKTNVS